jgi:hypothetical protein
MKYIGTEYVNRHKKRKELLKEDNKTKQRKE